jgi:hypothetical protein
MLTDITYKSNDRKSYKRPFTLAYNVKPVDLRPVYSLQSRGETTYAGIHLRRSLLK